MASSELAGAVETAIRAEVEAFATAESGPDVQATDAVGINSGHCRWLARRVIDRLDDPDGVVRRDAAWVHTWLEVDGEHYDAERPAGVAAPRDLPVWSRIDTRAGAHDVEELLAVAGVA